MRTVIALVVLLWAGSATQAAAAMACAEARTGPGPSPLVFTLHSLRHTATAGHLQSPPCHEPEGSAGDVCCPGSVAGQCAAVAATLTTPLHPAPLHRAARARADLVHRPVPPPHRPPIG